MKKKYIICLFIIIILILILICFSTMLYTKNKKNIQNVTTTYEERILWNTILNNNKYLSKIDVLTKNLKNNTTLVKIAIASDEVPTEYIDEEDIANNYLLTKGNGYKKSIKEINKYLKENFNQSSLEYNLIDTYVKNGKYLIIDEDYVYFTKIDIPEKVYIAIEYNVDGNDYVAKIYEYDITEDNKKVLNEMLETGNIDTSVEISNSYIIKGKIKGEKIKIYYKYKQEEDLLVQ